eukprot:m.209033 g.209033  ORF g.209033 m.209033 type:complete len:153 (-) comp13771_c0_seq6:2674-3132(-)
MKILLLMKTLQYTHSYTTLLSNELMYARNIMHVYENMPASIPNDIGVLLLRDKLRISACSRSIAATNSVADAYIHIHIHIHNTTTVNKQQFTQNRKKKRKKKTQMCSLGSLSRESISSKVALIANLKLCQGVRLKESRRSSLNWDVFIIDSF